VSESGNPFENRWTREDGSVTTPASPSHHGRSNRTLRSLKLTKRFLTVLAMAGLFAFALAAPTASAAAHVTCETNGARWHLAEYFETKQHRPNGETIYREASGDRYRFIAPDEAFCHAMDPWIQRLTGAANDKNFEDDSGAFPIKGSKAKFHVPPGYGLIPKDLTPPGYICMATVDDPRPGHHHDNAHWGNCTPVTGSRLGAWSWFSVLPPEQ
jgi:hypothetical protein